MSDDLPEAAEETIAGIQSARQEAIEHYADVTESEPEMVPCDRCESDVWNKRGKQRTPVVERTGFARLCPRCEVVLLVKEGHRFDTPEPDPESIDETPDEQPADTETAETPSKPTPDETGAVTLGDFASTTHD